MSKTTGVIAAAHGKFSEGIVSTVKMIAGEFPNLANINFQDGDTYDTLDAQYKQTFDKLKNFDQYIIITDLMGGTPFNRAVMNYGQEENVRILSGLNFASLFTAVTGENDDLDAFVDEIIQAGIKSISKFELEIKEDEEDDLDGI